MSQMALILLADMATSNMSAATVGDISLTLCTYTDHIRYSPVRLSVH